MKKLFIFIATALLMSQAVCAQNTVSGAIKPTTGVANGVTIFLRSSVSISGKVSGVTLALAIPVSVGARPTIVIDNSPNVSVNYTLQNTIDQNIQGEMYYVYNLLGDGDQSNAAVIYNLNAGVEAEIVKVQFGGNLGNAQIRMVNLPDGGTDPNPNSFFGISVFGDEKTNETSMFYSVPGISTAQNEIIPGGYSGLSITTTIAPIVLPVQFANFTVTKNVDDALLVWETENETATASHYEIERSLNGMDFIKINTVTKTTINTPIKTYRYTDQNINGLKNEGLVYYRIKEVDLQGEAVLTDVKSIRVTGNKQLFTVYPNPIQSRATIQLHVSQPQSTTVKIHSAEGKLVQSILWALQPGYNTRSINLSHLPAGNYFVQLQLDGELITTQLIKD